MRKPTMLLVLAGLCAASVLGASGAHAQVDCVQVRKMSDAGKSPRDIAEAMSITTPDVEQCIAGGGFAKPVNPSQLPAEDGFGGVDDNIGNEIPDEGPYMEQE